MWDEDEREEKGCQVPPDRGGRGEGVHDEGSEAIQRDKGEDKGKGWIGREIWTCVRNSSSKGGDDEVAGRIDLLASRP